MAVKISELTASAALTSDDFLPVVDSGSMTTRRASAQQVLDYITGSTFNNLTVTVLTGSTVTGSLALFTDITASKALIEDLTSPNAYFPGALGADTITVYTDILLPISGTPLLFSNNNFLNPTSIVYDANNVITPTADALLSGNVDLKFTSLNISNNAIFSGSIFVSGSSIYGQVAELTSSTDNYTLLSQDSGKFLNVDSGSAVSVTVPAGLPTGFTISVCQLGSGSVSFITGSGVVINNRQNHTKTAGQYSVASLVGTAADVYVLVGDTTT